MRPTGCADSEKIAAKSPLNVLGIVDAYVDSEGMKGLSGRACRLEPWLSAALPRFHTFYY